MSRRRYVTTEVEIDVYEALQYLDGEDLAELARGSGYQVHPIGDGDAALAENTIERAYLAAKRMATLSREIADLFWHVHGRAL